MRCCRTILLLAGSLVVSAVCHGQRMPTAVRSLAIEAGGGVSFAKPDYGSKWISGASAFVAVDLVRYHLGVELDVHDVDWNTPLDLGEVTYLGGIRYTPNFMRFKPYAKGMMGLGTIKYHQGYFRQESSETHRVIAAGGGLEMPLTPHLNLRVLDAEYQIWPSYGAHGLSPMVFTTGVAYRF